MKQSAVFLDRDGVVNAMVYHPEFGIVDSPANPEEFTLLPCVGEAIARLNGLGFQVIIVSNQPGIAKGRFTRALLDATTTKMLHSIREAGGVVDAVRYCLHHPSAVLPEYRVACDCRKPKPGLLLTAAKELDIDLGRSFLVGDGVTDLLAAKAAGTTGIFISSRKCYVCDELAKQGVQPDYMVANLREAVEVIERSSTGQYAALAHYVPACAAFS